MPNNIIRIFMLLCLGFFVICLITGCGGGDTGTSSSLPGVEPSINSIPENSEINLSSDPMNGPQQIDQSAEEEASAELPSEAATLFANAVLSPKPLSQIKTWACELQNIETRGAVDLLVNSRYDLLVLEPVCTEKYSAFNTKSMVDRIKASPAGGGVNRKLVLAYIDIGEAENWRYYWTWSVDWSGSGSFPSDWPSYIVTPNSEGWSGDYPVAYWDSRWKDIVIYGNNAGSGQNGYKSLVDEAILHGFDGIFLDCVQVYEDPAISARAKKDGKNASLEMVNFIKEIRDYVKNKKPGFLIMQNNGVELGVNYPSHMRNIDIIHQEAIWYDGTSSNGWSDPGGYDKANSKTLSQYYINQLKFYKNAGKPVFNMEYARNYAAAAYNKSKAQGYIAYCTRRSLSKLTTTPPPGY